MTIASQFSAAREQIEARARNYRQAAVAAARDAARTAAESAARAKQPVRTLAVAGQKLSSLSSRYFEQLFGQQAHTLEGVIEAGVERLKSAAQAKTFADLVQDQKDFGASSRERLGKDIKATWKIASDTGVEIRDLAVETYAELIHGVKTRRAVTPRAKRSVKKSTRARKAR